jgi:hypothetical protein
MISDALTRLSGTKTVTSGVVTETPQDLDPAAAATPLLSEHYIDLADRGSSNGNIADGPLCGVFTFVGETPAAGANDTIRLQLITMPRAVVAGQTFTAATATDLCTITGGDYLPTGTLVTLSSSTTLPGGLAASTHYYVLRDEDCAEGTNVFKLATTPDGTNRAAVAATTVVNIASTGTGTHTITHIPQIIADSGEIPLSRCRISKPTGSTSGQPTGASADQIVVTTNPLPDSPVPPLHRYVFARYIVSSNLTAGKAFCDVGPGVPSNKSISHTSGFFVA